MALGEEAGFPECRGLGARGRVSFPRAKEGTRGRIFIFFVFLPHFFLEVLPHYLKLLVQIWKNFKFFKYILLVFLFC